MLKRDWPLILFAVTSIALIIAAIGSCSSRDAGEPASAQRSEAQAVDVAGVSGVDIDQLRRDGAEVEIITRTREETHGGSASASGRAHGAGLNTSAAESASNFNSSTPSLDLGLGFRAEGGGLAWSAKMLGGKSFNAAHFIAILLFVGGGLFFAVPQLRIVPRAGTIGIGLMGLGVLLFAVASAEPWVWNLVVIGAVLIVIGVVVYLAWKESRSETSKSVFVHGLDRLKGIDSGAYEKAKDAVAAEAGVTRRPMIDAEVQRIKAAS